MGVLVNPDAELYCQTVSLHNLVGPLDDLALERIAMELDELPLPFCFDLLSADRLTHPALKAHIERVGVALYVPAC